MKAIATIARCRVGLPGAVVVGLLASGWPALAGDLFGGVFRDVERSSQQLYEEYADCVVGVDVLGSHQSQVRDGKGQRQLPVRRGTGFVVDAAGYIVTSQRLFEGVATDGVSTPVSVRVMTDDGDSYTGELWGLDPLTRVAVVRTDRTFPHALTFARETPEIGSIVFTLTRPFDLPTSIYQGTINGRNRSVREVPVERLLQTSLPLYAGGPGSPVLLPDGKVVGMLQDTRHQPQISFALPTPRLARIAEQLIEHRRAMRGYLGVRVEPITPQRCAQYRLEPHCDGALVAHVYEGSVAAEAGILPDDVIVAMDGAPIDTPEELIYEMYDYRPGDELQLRCRRGDESYTVELVLRAYPPGQTDGER